MAIMLPYSQWKPWRERIRHFTWSWHAVIMGTGITSALIHLFPYNNDSQALKIVALIIFLLNLVLFVFVCTCTILRYIMFPEVWSLMISHPAQSLFMGCFPMGAATLINCALNIHSDWKNIATRHPGFLWALWGLWWLDALFSYCIAFGMIYAMMVRQDHAISKMTAVWLLPVVTLVVASSTGGLCAAAIREYSHSLALVTVGFCFVMAGIGITLVMMMICCYFIRLVTAGPPDAGLILSAFIVLGPLGQGGFSLLVNGQNMSELLPLHIVTDFPQSQLAGQMIFSGCFIGSYILWSMGFAWIILACISITHVVWRNKVPFSLAYWGVIFPNGTFALLSVELSRVLDSGFFRAFGAAWSIIVFILWTCIFIRSIPSFIDGSMFKAPYIIDGPSAKEIPTFDIEKVEQRQTVSENSTRVPSMNDVAADRPL